MRRCRVWRFSGRELRKYVGSRLSSSLLPLLHSLLTHCCASCSQALNYLNHSFYLPTLYPSSTSSHLSLNASSSSSPSSPAYLSHLPLLSPLLQQHKTLSKSLTKDRSQSDINLSLRQLKRDLRAWLDTAERLGGEGAGVDALVEALTGRMEGENDGVTGDEEEVGGVLVPISKKKRSRFSSNSPHPPESLLSLYGPLLQSLSRVYTSIPSTLTSRITLILSTATTPTSIFSSTSYTATLASWLVWAYDELLAPNHEDGSGEGEERDEVVKGLVKVAWGNEEVVRILRVLEGRDESMRERLGGLLDVLGGREGQADGSEVTLISVDGPLSIDCRQADEANACIVSRS
jgi:hypothetical protein